MTKEQLLNVLRTNKVPYNKALDGEATCGYPSDEYAEYAQKLYGDLFTIASYGVQNGFGSCRDEIRDLTDLVAKLLNGTKRVNVNFDKTEKKRQQILKHATYLRKEMNMDMMNQLTGNLDACISAAEAIITIRSDDPTLCGKLEESKQVLTEIKTALGDVVDVTSRDAAEYQARIFEALMDWRESVCRYNCYSDTVDGLKGALEKAKEWQKLSATARNRAKPNEDYYVYDEKYDEISYITSAAKYAERTSGLHRRLADFNKQTEYLYSVEARKSELENLRREYLDNRGKITSRLAEIKNETNSLLIQYQNGELDAVTADVKVGELDEEAAELNEQLKELDEDYEYDYRDLSEEVKNNGDDAKVRNKLAKSFETFIKKIEAYRDTDPAMFVMLCSRINFNDVNDTLAGKLSADQVDEVFITVDTIIRQTEEDIKKQRKNLVGFNSINFARRERRREEERVLREQERERRESERERRAAERAPLGERAAAAAASAEEEAKARLGRRLAQNGGIAAPQTEDRNDNEDGVRSLRNDDK